MTGRNHWLIAAGWMSIIAALAHAACIVGGPGWYHAMGAPPALVRAAEHGDLELPLITAMISAIIFVWAAYAFSATGLFKRLPLTRLALIAIAFVLILRGLSYFLLPLWDGWRPDLSPTFMVWSSLASLLMGLSFAIGTWRAWPSLTPREVL